MFEKNDFADVTITCDKQEVKCHRFVLSEQSAVMRRSFRTEVEKGEKKPKNVEVSVVGFELLLKILRLLYGGSVEFAAEEIPLLLKYASTYGVTSLREDCFSTIQDNISSENAILVWKLADNHEEAELSVFAQKYCVRNFWQRKERNVAGVVNSRWFPKLGTERLVKLVSDERLAARNEQGLFKAIFDWIIHNPDKRLEHAQSILESCLRSHSLTARQIRDVIKKASATTTIPPDVIHIVMNFTYSLPNANKGMKQLLEWNEQDVSSCSDEESD